MGVEMSGLVWMGKEVEVEVDIVGKGMMGWVNEVVGTGWLDKTGIKEERVKKEDGVGYEYGNG
ncbi:hypothetical protein, partial [Paenibacillus sp. Y412MC10]|uniref:hypothetical protein n=1 Tax=Geobacillus sp. (strain Y412MC10) TaxID=481743 RepID=UPI001C92F4A4